jgi:ketosteroid isomerase-like protein
VAAGPAATPWIRHRATGTEAADHCRQTARATGTPYRARFALRLTVSGGRITRHHVEEDSLAVARAFGA